MICPDCDGYGEVRHPLWGSRNCPEPTAECRTCWGSGELSDACQDDDDWRERRSA